MNTNCTPCSSALGRLAASTYMNGTMNACYKHSNTSATNIGSVQESRRCGCCASVSC